MPPEGTAVSVQGAVSVEEASVSEKVASTRSTLPFASTSRMRSVPATRTGFAPSAGERGREGGEVAGGVADAGGAGGERDREGADGGVGSSRAFGDRRAWRPQPRPRRRRACRPRGRSRASTGRCPPSRPRATRRRWRARGRPCRWSCCLASRARRGSVRPCPSCGRSTPAPTRRRKLLVADAEIVIGPSARLEASMPVNVRTPPPVDAGRGRRDRHDPVAQHEIDRVARQRRRRQRHV